MNKYEAQFLETYGNSIFVKIQEYIINNDIIDYYNKAKNDPITLFRFGLHYGIIEIVAFCYCILKISIDINQEVSGYYIQFNSGDRASSGVSVESSGSKTKMTAATIDKFTPFRSECIKYLCNLRKYSKRSYVREHGKSICKYTINDKYIKDYRLLEVQSFIAVS